VTRSAMARIIVREGGFVFRRPTITIVAQQIVLLRLRLTCILGSPGIRFHRKKSGWASITQPACKNRERRRGTSPDFRRYRAAVERRFAPLAGERRADAKNG